MEGLEGCREGGMEGGKQTESQGGERCRKRGRCTMRRDDSFQAVKVAGDLHVLELRGLRLSD